jgi:hypothetical protein
MSGMSAGLVEDLIYPNGRVRKACHARFPLLNPLPQTGEEATESLRGFLILHSLSVSLPSVMPLISPLSVTPTNTVPPCALAKVTNDSTVVLSKEALNSSVWDSPAIREGLMLKF